MLKSRLLNGQDNVVVSYTMNTCLIPIFLFFLNLVLARASREMLFKCLALEQPSIRCLNYIPGIVNTDMLRQAFDINPEHYKSIIFNIFFGILLR